ncbi:MAG TPA: hypothetical protein VKU40_04195 [Thermoanaerobaculia bacterium]|nr:hypothetical protein [Thermoanaerobaculia bacterium]
MRVITSTVVGGKVEIPEATLEEGSRVAILAPDGDEPIELTANEQQELSAAMDEIRRGDFIDGTELLAEIRTRASR